MAISHKEVDRFIKRLMQEPRGKGYREKLGRKTWYIMKRLGAEYGCSSCQPGADMILNYGPHDLINIKTGKGVQDKRRFAKYVAFVNAMAYRADVKKMPEYHEALAKALKLSKNSEVNL